VRWCQPDIKFYLLGVRVAEPELGRRRPQGEEKKDDENVSEHFLLKLCGRENSMEMNEQQISRFGLVKLIRSGQVRSS
jgi:hypothetical protein